MATTLLIVAILGGAGYFAFWATKRTLAEDSGSGKRKKRSRRRR